MKEIYINMDKAKEDAREIEAFKKELDRMVSEIYSIRGNLAFRAASASLYKERLRELAEQIEDESKATKILSDKLIEIVSAYHRAEQRIINNAGGMGGDGKEDNPSEPTEGESKDDTLTLEDAIQFLRNGLEGLNLPTAIAEIVLAIVECILSLYEKTKDVANVVDDVADVVGPAALAMNAAADIMAAIEDKTSVNALISDLIVDLMLFGIGEGAEWGGGAIGTLIAPGVGTVIGKAVGGVIGSAFSIAMETIDVNGDEEGGTGKDALSDWLEGIFDKLWGDYDF